jgi:hypothetical protein
MASSGMTKRSDGIIAHHRDPDHGCPVQTPTLPDASVRAPIGLTPRDARAAPTHPPPRSAAMAGCGPRDLCPAPLHRPSPGRAPRTQGPHRRHGAARLAGRPGTRPGAGEGVKEGPPRRAEARLRSQGSTTVVWPPTADGVSAGRLAADTGPVTRRPSVRTTQRRMGCYRWPEGACA